METFKERILRGGDVALAEAEKFFMQTGAVYQTLRRIAQRLSSLGIPYAVVGGMAVTAHGQQRTTEDVDILVTQQALERIHAELEGLGYVAPFKGSKSLLDADTRVKIEFLITGRFPGDGAPKPVAFPDPANTAVEIDGICYVNLPTLIELKLASAMTGAARSMDYGDVDKLIDALDLPLDFSKQLNEYVRAKYEEHWHDVQKARLQRKAQFE
jgi:hypothetical protein